MSNPISYTHYADEGTLAYIAKLEAENEALKEKLWNHNHGTAMMCADAAIGAAQEWEKEVAALKEQVADHQLLFKDYATAQHRIKQLREVLGYYTNATSGTDGEDDGGIARRVLALPDNTAELDAVMKDAERYRWLKSTNGDWQICYWNEDDIEWNGVTEPERKNIDAAINAAMKEQP